MSNNSKYEYIRTKKFDDPRQREFEDPTEILIERKDWKMPTEMIKKGTNVVLPEPDFLPKRIRVNKWKSEYIHQAFYLALLGLTDVQMGQCMGVAPHVIRKWQKQHPAFREAIHRGKMIADGKVAHSMYQAAIGYSHEEEVILSNRVREMNEKGKVIKEYTEPLRVKTVKNYPPNVTAGFRWLQARQPEKWSQKVEVSGKVDHVHSIDLSKFSTEELLVLQKLGVQQENEAPPIEDAEYTEE